jgi:hypothetical protein
MPGSRNKFYALQVTLLLTGISWSATLPHPPPTQSIGVPNLRRMTRESGYIFAGTVTAVESVTSSNRVPTTKITFHVNQAIRGVTNGQTLVIQEWAGLWESGEYYRLGEQVLLFLYRPSKLGLTSPVGGQQGRFKLDSNGTVTLRQERVIRLFANPASMSMSPGTNHVSIPDFARAIHQAEEE